MMITAAHSRPVPTPLRAMVLIESAVVGWAAALLLLSPRLADQWWAWSTPPFNARYIGAVYFGALLPLLLFLLRPYVSPGRVVLWMIFTFTTSVAIVMLFSADRFAFDRLHAWVYWLLYLALPVASAYFLVRLGGLRKPPEPETPAARRGAMTVVALVTGGYGIALLAVPQPAAGWWPWPVDAFHARLYAATFLTAAAGAWLAGRRAAPRSWLAVGTSLLGLGLAAVAGTLITGATRSLDLADAIPFFAAHLALAAVGGVMLAWARASSDHELTPEAAR